MNAVWPEGVDGKCPAREASSGRAGTASGMSDAGAVPPLEANGGRRRSSSREGQPYTQGASPSHGKERRPSQLQSSPFHPDRGSNNQAGGGERRSSIDDPILCKAGSGNDKHHAQALQEMGSITRARVANADDRESLSRAGKSDIRSIKVLGEGAFGIVDLVRVTGAGGSQLLCVRKKLLKANDNNANDPAKEVEALEAVRSSTFTTQLWHCVVGLYDYTLLLEYCPYGTLEKLLQEVCIRRSRSGNACLDLLVLGLLRAEKHAGLSEDEARFYTACCLMALEALHSAGYMHRDVKPSNCLFAENGYLKLSDLGLAKHLDQGAKAHSQAGTPFYMAPEVVHGKHQGYSFSADMWSLGVMLWEMVDGALPKWAAMSWYWTKTLHCPDGFSPDLKSLLSGMLEKNPRDRPTASAALKHPWFASLDLAALRVQTLPAPNPPELADQLVHAGPGPGHGGQPEARKAHHH